MTRDYSGKDAAVPAVEVLGISGTEYWSFAFHLEPWQETPLHSDWESHKLNLHLNEYMNKGSYFKGEISSGLISSCWRPFQNDRIC